MNTSSFSSTGRLVGFLCVLSLATGLAFGQQRALVIESNADSASVFVDGAWAGFVVDGPFDIPALSEEIVVRPPGNGVWSIDPLWFELEPGSEERVELDAAFDYHYRIESAPSGASVYAGQQRLGLTPLVYRAENPLEGAVRFHLEGYREITRSLESGLWNHIPVELEPLASVPEAVRSDHIVDDKGPNWVNIAVGATAFAAGALAVHYRTKADNRFDDYGVSGKESLRSDIRRLDVQSGVALGVMQAGLGFVAFRLAF